MYVDMIIFYSELYLIDEPVLCQGEAETLRLQPLSSQLRRIQMVPTQILFLHNNL